MSLLQQNYQNVSLEIQRVCRRVGRDPRTVRVIAVTKYVDIPTAEEALDLGIEHLGESRVQEAMRKWDQLGERGTWHFIGHLQRNKVKEVLARFQYIHSLDRFSLAEEIQKRAERVNKVIPCFVQINVAQEEQKHGLLRSEVEDFVRQVSTFSHLKLVGLMTMAPYTEEAEETRPVFQELKRIQRQIQKWDLTAAPVPHLSMGMSRDYQVAIEEGATWIRLGSTLVGRTQE
ncbi:YggS family pyridoxal phosphate-dependent enzyme [Mechercharimyces sp. CAU 1602]|uniref:YggS family pyridoxal phosphate-dependent enzyme n=1 Tax=Mechercharimyces sp. CAU 1602 TaxID=2973933 RepID=UPI002161C144|nr:YggS family pyridoxal phosphate-dependent enzyme [Mechercharimyces sp. CAU 1602]MCS1350635.1 YggS family pyridoxal phosphate-dependent enzyme [Mechercharimyces sp. CAU 1602]